MKLAIPFRIISPVCLVALAVGRPPAVFAEGRLTITRTPGGGAAVEVDGKPFATYVVDRTNKPYLWPIYGPTGKPMTRAYPMQDLPEEPAAQRDHPHHRGITFGLESAGDSETWHDRSTFEEAIGKGKTPNQTRARIATLGETKKPAASRRPGGLTSRKRPGRSSPSSNAGIRRAINASRKPARSRCTTVI